MVGRTIGYCWGNVCVCLYRYHSCRTGNQSLLSLGKWVFNGRLADMYVGATNADGVTITPQHRTKNKLNYAFTVSATWSFYKGMGLTADFTQMERSPRMTDYANMGPQDLRLRIPLLRGGIYYRNKWIDVTSMITWIQKTNNIRHCRYLQSTCFKKQRKKQW